MSRRLLPVLAAAGIVCLAACGPSTPLSLIVRDANTNVTYGKQGTVQGALPAATGSPYAMLSVPFGPPLTPILPPPPFESGGFPQGGPFVPPVGQLPSPIALLCQQTSVPPVLAAPASASAPPLDGYYSDRQSGTELQNGQRVALPSALVAKLSNAGPATSASAPTGAFDYTIAQSDQDSTVTTTYQVTSSGMYITNQQTTRYQQETATFAPLTPLQIMNFPAQVEQVQTQSRAVDPTAGETMTTSFQTLGLSNVGLCGVNVQAWEVYVATKVQFVEPDVPPETAPALGAQCSFAYLYVTPQYGALIVQDVSHVTDNCSDWPNQAVPGTNLDVRSTITLDFIGPSQTPPSWAADWSTEQ